MVSYIVLVIGALLLLSAGCDELRGKTSISNGRHSHSSSHLDKKNQPEPFRRAMTYHWTFAMLISLAGVILYAAEKHLEESDPESPDYAGNQALDDWGKAMDQEAERRKPRLNTKPPPPTDQPPQ